MQPNQQQLIINQGQQGQQQDQRKPRGPPQNPVMGQNNPPMDNKQSKLATQLFNSNGQTIQQELNKKIFTIQEESPRSEAYEKEFSEASTDALTTVR